MDTYIPTKAHDVMPVIAEEAVKFKVPFDVGFITAMIEQESCISLRHSRCFSVKSNFRTRWKNGKRREEGAGLLMLTRAWTSSGRLRLDTLSALTKKYRTHLRGLNWSTVYNNPRLQVRAGLFLLLDNWHRLPKTVTNCNKLPMILSAYNQGMGGLSQDRRICGMTKGCNPNKWFGNVENVKRAWFATRILYGRRTAHQINRTHVRHVMKHRLPKYRKHLEKFYKGD